MFRVGISIFHFKRVILCKKKKKASHDRHMTTSNFFLLEELTKELSKWAATREPTWLDPPKWWVEPAKFQLI